MREKKTGGRVESFRAKIDCIKVMIQYRTLTEAYVLLRIKGNYKNV